MKRANIKAALSLPTAAIAIASSHAAACAPVPVSIIEPAEPPDYRAECRAVIRDVDAYLAETSEDDLQRGRRIDVAKALREGSANCPERPGIAFELADRMIGSPALARWRSEAVRKFMQWKPMGFDSNRVEEVAIGSWIASDTHHSACGYVGYSDQLPRSYSERQVTEWLVKPEYWAAAMASFGQNPARDRIILRQLIDPQSAYFDLAEATRLTPQYFGRGDTIRPKLIDIEVAEAITDPRLGVPDYEAAARLLAWYSPFVFRDIPQEARARARELWVRISQTRLTSADPQLERDAMLFFETGDPWAKPRVPLSQVLPANAEVIILDHWPEHLAQVSAFDQLGEFLVERGAYPSRALRQERGGKVELGLVFGPDGAFYMVHVSRRNFEVLENAAKRSVERGLRPRIIEMRLEGFEGRYVYVPLPSFEYSLAENADNLRTGYDAERGSFVIAQSLPFRGGY